MFTDTKSSDQVQPDGRVHRQTIWPALVAIAFLTADFDVACVVVDVAAESLSCAHALREAITINAAPASLSILIEFIGCSSFDDLTKDPLQDPDVPLL